MPLLLALALHPTHLSPQAELAEPVVVTGRVSTAAGRAVAGARVRAMTLSAVTTSDEQGRFVLPITSGTHRILLTKIAFVPETLVVVVPDGVAAVSVSVVLRAAPSKLEPVRVAAGSYRTGYDRHATLTPIQAVNVPGAGGDLGRAIQSFPGVQLVDEGNGVYVRGGEAGETRVLLNEVAMVAAPRLESPAGTVAPSVNPFLLDGIAFSAGAFSVRHGNALSSIIDLRSQGRPTTPAASANVALNVLSSSAALPLTRRSGIRASASRSDASLAVRLNGSSRRYAPAPNGSDIAGSVAVVPRAGSELKVFAIRQRSGFGIARDDPALLSSASSPYVSRQESLLATATWRAAIAHATTTFALGTSVQSRSERVGVSTFDTRVAARSAAAHLALPLRLGVVSRVGADVEIVDARLDDDAPVWLPNGSQSGPRVDRAGRVRPSRQGFFTELEWYPAPPFRITAGTRADWGGGSARRTVDPRVDAALRLWDGLSLTAAVGVYHQRVDPLTAARLLSRRFEAARARQRSLGLQWDAPPTMMRLEVYEKRYADLTSLTRERDVFSGGRGDGRGLDLFARIALPRGLAARVVYGFVDGQRTDPNTGRMSVAPAAVTHTLMLVAEGAWARSWRAAAAYRAATGRPFTPVVSGIRDASGPGWLPVYGDPMSERLPAYTRVDISTSRVWQPASRVQLVTYAALTNALDRSNVFGYRYSGDFQQRVAVRSAFKRALYLGASVTYAGAGGR